MTETDLSAERVARNDAIFREANESIMDAAEEYGIRGGLPFICECAEPSCTTIIRVPVEEYERVRSSPTHFLNASGHDAAAGPHAVAVERRDGYDIVQKVGDAAEVAAELDTRTS